ncbi:MAG: glycosyltransferase [Patescibacteria group bacterium]|mgnify:CR=1 FL=1
MKLLITTQVVDPQDPFLGFFHGWIAELAKHFEHIEVICLRMGQYSLPANVNVHSLGKEGGARSRIAYALRFLSLVWKLRSSYDAVFVHMNQEYILLAGWLWKILRKRIYMWRNHYAGGFLTDVAAMTALKVFCTSRYSFTAKYKKTVVMPVGVDAELFAPSALGRAPRSVLFFSRFAPAKKPDVLLEALGVLSKEGIQFRASFYGTALPADADYRDRVIARAKELGLSEHVKFHLGVPHTEAPGIFGTHEIFVNLSSSGTYDKTMFEAAACGCVVVASSKDFAAIVGERFLVADSDAKDTADKLRELLSLTPKGRASMAAELRGIVLQGHSLETLGERLAEELAS